MVVAEEAEAVAVVVVAEVGAREVATGQSRTLPSSRESCRAKRARSSGSADTPAGYVCKHL